MVSQEVIFMLMLIMLVVKSIEKVVVELVNFLIICLFLGLAESKILLLFLLLKLNILLLVVVVLKSYGSNNNWVILVTLYNISIFCDNTSTINITKNHVHALSILRLGIISLEIIHLKVTYALNILISQSTCWYLDRKSVV